MTEGLYESEVFEHKGRYMQVRGIGKFHKGTLFKIRNYPEVLKVECLTAKSILVERGYGSTKHPGTDYPVGSVIDIIAHPITTDGKFLEDPDE